MDRNGYNPSILQNGEYECYLCGVPFPLERHEAFGASNRKKSKADGLWVSLCPVCHRGSEGVHASKTIAMRIKTAAERAWIEKNSKTVNEFRDRYGRNYL